MPPPSRKRTQLEGPAPFKLDPKRLRKGDYVSRVSYLEVTAETCGDCFGVKNTDGKEWSIDEGIVKAECKSPHEFSRTVEVVESDIAEALSKSYPDVFKVRFLKQNGEGRVLIGHLMQHQGKGKRLGRAQVIDLKRLEQRQVDYRTLQELVLDGVHYVDKKYRGERFTNA